MRIAIEGCCHGELDKIYDTLKELERQNGFKIDVLIICGDFQAVRNFDDLLAMAVPQKYQQLNTFYKYYSQEKVAPLLTVFIGGNHEASNYMQELPYGGWVAPNIYFMGYAGIIQIGGLRIGGISGIFKGHDFNRGHFERPPYGKDTVRSVYHVRNLEVFRLKQITRPLDIFISHDWPKGIYHYGNTASLIKQKPFFQKEIEENKLGSSPLCDLLFHLQPVYWFSAHLHVKFAAHVQHQSKSDCGPGKCTKFLALDKCLPRRNFLQVLEIPHDTEEGVKIKLDPEWLVILQKTDHLLNLTCSNRYMPGPGCGDKHDFRVDNQEIETAIKTFGGDLSLPLNFVHTSPPLLGNIERAIRQRRQELTVQVNPQTTLLCAMLNITDPNAKFSGRTSHKFLDERDTMEGDDGEDDVNDSSDDEIPSTIDSSMDITASDATNASTKWDTCETGNETLDSSDQGSVKQSHLTSTPAKDSVLDNPSFDVQVDDNDEEFLSILSAQKNKSIDISLPPHTTPSLKENSLACPHKADLLHSTLHSDQLKFSNHKTSSSVTEDGDLSGANVSTSICSHEVKNISLDDCQHVSLRPERTSFGMSGLCLDPAKTPQTDKQSSSLCANKSDCSLYSESIDTSVLNVINKDVSPAKKLKRRNVSLYSEPIE